MINGSVSIFVPAGLGACPRSRIHAGVDIRPAPRKQKAQHRRGVGLFVLLGNYLGKSHPNWFAGVRTPWTLSSDYAWEKTHRWAGRLFVLTGFGTLAAWLTTDERTTILVMIVAITITALASVALSYFFWRNDPERASDNSGA